MRRIAAAALALLVLSCFASAQAIYRTGFDSDEGWTFDPPNASGTRWKVDALPASTPLGPYRSAPYSLNYNNDVDYAGSAPILSGIRAISPPIDLTLATGTPMLVFACNNQLAENMCDNHESVVVLVFRGHTAMTARCLTCAGCFHNQARISPCNLAAWHAHTIPLDASWGVVRIVFVFKGDSIANETAGLFVDDLAVLDLPSPLASAQRARLPTGLYQSPTCAPVPAPFALAI